jgi:uncharacterized protein YbjT (DUF2867 family)
MATQLASALGRPVAFVNVPPDAVRAALLGAGFPEWQADGLIEDYAHYRRGEASAVIEDYAHYRRGEASAVTTGVKDATGRSPRAFAEFARDYAPAFT